MFFRCELAENEIDVAYTLAKLLIAGAEAKAWEIFGAEMLNGGLEAIVAACAAPLAEADLAEWEIEIVANNENILRGELVKVAEAADTHALIVIESLWFYEENIAVLGDFGFELWLWLESEIMNFGIKIES